MSSARRVAELPAAAITHPVAPPAERGLQPAEALEPAPRSAPRRVSPALLDHLSPPAGSLRMLSVAETQAAVRALPPEVRREEIGRSRDGRPLFGLEVGRGPRRIVAMAGAHADEPLGTATILHLARVAATHPALAALRERVTLALVPQANPDGSSDNEAWFGPWSAGPDLVAYSTHVRRASFDRDVEFGFPAQRGGHASPENTAIARWFDRQGAISHYASLHSMSLNGGAWFLVKARDLGASTPLLHRLLGEAEALGLPLHSELGSPMFAPIGPGLNHAPPSHGGALNSMDYVARHNGCPLSMVTEIPLFYSARMGDTGPRAAAAAKKQDALVLRLAERAEAARALAGRLRGFDLGGEGAAFLAQLEALAAKGHGPTQVERGASVGDADYVELNLRRRLCAYLATAAAALRPSPDPEARRLLGRLEKELTREVKAFAQRLRFPPLEVQSRLQIAALLAPELYAR